MFEAKLTPEERKAFGRIIQEKQMYAKWEVNRFHKGPTPKDTGRFTLESDPQIRRPGPEGHRSPSASHEADPSSVAQDPSPAPSGNAQAKPDSASSEPARANLADLLAADKQVQDFPVSNHEHAPAQPERTLDKVKKFLKSPVGAAVAGVTVLAALVGPLVGLASMGDEST